MRDWGRGILWLSLGAVPVVFSTRTTEAFELPKLLLLRAVAIVLVAGAAATGAKPVWARLRAVLREPITLGVLLSLAAAVLSTAFSMGRLTSLRGAEASFAGLVTAVALAVLFFGVRLLSADLASARTVAVATATGTGVSVAYGLLQLADADPLRWKAPVVFSGVSRVFSTQGHPNALAQLFAVSVPVVCYLLVRALQQRRLVAALVHGLVVGSAIALTVLTLSRAGALGLLTGLGVLGASGALGRRHGRGRWLAGFASLAVAGAALALVPDAGSLGMAAMWSRIEGLVRGSWITDDPRRFLWTAAWQMFERHPISGVGLDCFSLAYGSYRSADSWVAEWGQTPLKAHSQPLEILATRGLLGAAAAAVLGLGVARAFAAALRRPEGDRFMATALFASLLAFGVHNLFHFPTAAATALAAAFAAILSAQHDAPPADAPESGIPGLRALACAALAAAALHLLVLRPLRADVFCRAATDVMASRPQLALAYGSEATRLDPSRALLWSRLAAADQAAARATTAAAERRRLFEAGLAAAERAVALEPADTYSHAHLGTLLADLEREDPPLAARSDVEQAFERARSLDPDNSFVHVAAAAAALAAGDAKRASEWANECLRLYPGFGAPRALLGAVSLSAGRRLAADGDTAAAREALEQALMLLGEALAADWHGDVMARAAAMRTRGEARSALAALP